MEELVGIMHQGRFMTTVSFRPRNWRILGNLISKRLDAKSREVRKREHYNWIKRLLWQGILGWKAH